MRNSRVLAHEASPESSPFSIVKFFYRPGTTVPGPGEIAPVEASETFERCRVQAAATPPCAAEHGANVDIGTATSDTWSMHPVRSVHGAEPSARPRRA